MTVRTIVIACIIVCICFSVAPAGKEYRFEYQKIVNVRPTLELTINNANGNVRVMASSEYNLRVDATKRIYAESKSDADLIADHIQIGVNATEGHFIIEPHFRKIENRSPSFWEKLLGRSGEQAYGAVDFVVMVPVDCNLAVYNTSGNIEVTGLRGHVNLNGAGGNVAVRNIEGPLDIANSSGEIILQDIEGSVHINATGANINFSGITGNVELTNSSGQTTGEYLLGDLILAKTIGEIELNHIEGDIRIKSTSGKILIGQDYGSLDIYNEYGDISVKTELRSQKDYLIETVSGSIDFMIPEDSGGWVTMEVSSGDIDARIPIAIQSFSKTRLEGSFGTEGPRISLATQSGDIVLAEF